MITGSATAALTETNVAQSTGGTLSATDIDSSNAFVVQTNAAGSNGFGKFSIDAAGAWTYTMDSAHDEFVAGQTYTDSTTVTTADGTAQVLTVTMTGTNDPAVITGPTTAAITETNVAQSTAARWSRSTRTAPMPSSVQTNVPGSGGFGKFSIDAAGVWNYTMDTAHDEFVGGQTYTDSVTVATADGTTQVLTVTMTGTNDPAVITGTSTAALTETTVAQSTSGALSATDVDSPTTFVAQTNVAGSGGFGKFSIDAAGAWTYTMDTAHTEFAAGQIYTDTLAVTTADGTVQVLTVNMTGVNVPAVITGTATAALTESNVVQSTGGALTATDVDNPATFVVQTNAAGSNGFGQFSIDAAGTWTYTMNTPHDEFVGGQVYTDSITVTTADGTPQVLTVSMTGTNDAAVITGTATAALTETNVAQTTGGTLTSTDVDNSNTFAVQTSVAGSNGFGKFSIDAAGVWTYTMDSAHDEFVGGQTYTDSITVATADGTTQVLTVTMTGTNDAAVITGATNAALIETNVAQSTGGTLTAVDPDSSNAFTAQTNVAGSNGFGKFSIDAAGAWTYTMDTAHDEFVGGQTYTDSITVATADGTTQVVTVTMAGTNDAAVITGTATRSPDRDQRGAVHWRHARGDRRRQLRCLRRCRPTWPAPMASASSPSTPPAPGPTPWTRRTTSSSAARPTPTRSRWPRPTARPRCVTVTMTGTNDAAVITGTANAALTETNVAQSTGGTLTATDVDSSNAFVVQTAAAGSNGFGKFSIDAAGVWTYTMDSAHDEFVGGQTYTDSITVATADGTSQVLTVSMTGTNDAAVITGTSTAALTETNVAQSTGGALSATDVDSSAAFTVQTNAAGSNGFGKFSIDAAGAWTYTMDSAHDEFVGGQIYTDSITVATADGTTQVITVTMAGTNDAAVITGTATAALTETNVAQSTGGTLAATDVDSSAAFTVQTNAAGSNGFGKFTIDAAGAWTYTMDSAHDEFVGGQTYTDSITVATADGTSQVLTVTMTGTNDAAVITGTSTAALTETNVAQSTGGTLTATDVDSSNAFVVQTNVAGYRRLRQVLDRRSRRLDLHDGLCARRVRGRPDLYRLDHRCHRRRHDSGRDRDHDRHQRCSRDHRDGQRSADRDQRGAVHRRDTHGDRRRQLRGVRGADQCGRLRRFRQVLHRRGRRLDLHHGLRA